LRLAYVRIGGGFVEQLSNSPGGRQLMRSVLKTSGDLGIEVYADDVPDTRTRDLLSAMGIRVMQGAGVAEDSPELAAA
ncbi:MAG: EAL domain-containing protein, partial [Burkholderiaceae bacterium]|nr:EAL domain-containing protein [Burkholderiaceae bacterium]